MGDLMEMSRKATKLRNNSDLHTETVMLLSRTVLNRMALNHILRRLVITLPHINNDLITATIMAHNRMGILNMLTIKMAVKM